MNEPVGYNYEPRVLPGELPQQQNDSDEEDLMEIQIDNSRLNNLNWCSCGRCSLANVGSVRECVCCTEVECVKSRIFNSCITENVRFTSLCIDNEALETALSGMSASRADKLNKLIVRPINSSTYRLAAYRQFILWIYGHLGKYQRRIIPACAVQAIRLVYEEPTGVYTGYRDAIVRQI